MYRKYIDKNIDTSILKYKGIATIIWLIISGGDKIAPKITHKIKKKGRVFIKKYSGITFKYINIKTKNEIWIISIKLKIILKMII